jgi:cyclopropane fatty-acyl-phospholipid synthase-like methyltransferase
MERYVIRGGREGYARLRVLAAARRASTLELFQLAGLRPGMRCVDLGCGSGDVTPGMAALAGPAGRVTGIDADQAKLEYARARRVDADAYLRIVMPISHDRACECEFAVLLVI